MLAALVGTISLIATSSRLLSLLWIRPTARTMPFVHVANHQLVLQRCVESEQH